MVARLDISSGAIFIIQNTKQVQIKIQIRIKIQI
jgi:hypothetical protein